MTRIPQWQTILILAVMVLSLVFTVPNLLPREQAEALPNWLPNQQISLGLDLQGGSHLLLEVDVDAVAREQLEGLVDAVRTTLRAERIGYTGLGSGSQGVTFEVRDPAEAERAIELITQIEPGLTVSQDGSHITLALDEAAGIERIRLAVEQSIEVVRRRIDELGTREPVIQRQGERRIIVQLPGVDDPERVKNLLGQTARLTFHMVDTSVSAADAAAGRLPPGTMLLPSSEGDAQYVVESRVVVAGDTLENAAAQPGDSGGFVVSFRFNAEGGRKFAQVTTEHVGELLAIVLDGKVISAPRIDEPITGGSGIIRGRFTAQEANDLSILLRAGALPAPLLVLEERTVGPGLGADSIDGGAIACAVGFALVAAFMIVAYGWFGVVAVIALLFNVLMILASLSVLQATLTLPGIAGIVLTMGMAVDANVLIFERMREEVALGRSPFSVVDAGYRRAMTAIVDSNLTTLIAGVLLFAFGTGPVKGFAVTLSIGILTSMFTAIMITRLFIVAWLRRRRPQVLVI